MATRNILYKRTFPVNDNISIVIPSVGEILDNEDDYYHNVSAFTSMPVDLMVQLDDAGIDFSKINEYDLFLILFPSLQELNLSLIFDNIDFKDLSVIKDEDAGWVVKNLAGDVVINRIIHAQIAAVLRKIHHYEKNTRKPANDEAREYMIERERKKLNRKRNRQQDSELESLIIAMVNTEQYKYDFETTRELSIYQFNESVRQIIKKVDYSNRMHGVYSGTISVKDLSQDDLNWLIHK